MIDIGKASASTSRVSTQDCGVDLLQLWGSSTWAFWLAHFIVFPSRVALEEVRAHQSSWGEALVVVFVSFQSSFAFVLPGMISVSNKVKCIKSAFVLKTFLLKTSSRFPSISTFLSLILPIGAWFSATSTPWTNRKSSFHPEDAVGQHHSTATLCVVGKSHTAIKLSLSLQLTLWGRQSTIWDNGWALELFITWWHKFAHPFISITYGFEWLWTLRQ